MKLLYPVKAYCIISITTVLSLCEGTGPNHSYKWNMYRCGCRF